MRRSVLMVSILAFAAGCDKAKKPDGERPPTPTFDVASKPPLVFEVFGSRDTTRLVPIAVIVDGQVKPIVLTGAGWKALDSTYFQAGTDYPVFRDGQLAGTVKVTRRMWERDSEPLYELPGCRELRPMAAVSLSTKLLLDPAFEFLALSVKRANTAPGVAGPKDLTAEGRALATAALRAVQLDTADIDTASFSIRSLHVAGGAKPTLAVSQVDANAGDTGPGAGHTTHFLILGDDPDGKGYQATYSHLESGEARSVQFQRLLDHLDLTGDGTDEVVLESWRYAGTNDLVVLSRSTGKWHETLRVPQDWCTRRK